MKVLIQKNKAGEFPNINFFQADVGFKELGYHIEYFYSENGQCYSSPYRTDVVPCKETVVVGGIPVINWFYDKLGVTNPHLEDYPDELVRHTGRTLTQVTIGWVREQIQKDLEENQINQYFIKPLAGARKSFTGHIVSRFVDLLKTSCLDDGVIVWYSNVIKFVSEYRAFVHKGKLVGLKHYKGDFRIFPLTHVIDDMIKAYITAPVAYSLDVGIADPEHHTLHTRLIEVNDSNALGCYGLHPVTYANMIADRWNEVMKNDN